MKTALLVLIVVSLAWIPPGSGQSWIDAGLDDGSIAGEPRLGAPAPAPMSTPVGLLTVIGAPGGPLPVWTVEQTLARPAVDGVPVGPVFVGALAVQVDVGPATAVLLDALVTGPSLGDVTLSLGVAGGTFLWELSSVSVTSVEHTADDGTASQGPPRIDVALVADQMTWTHDAGPLVAAYDAVQGSGSGPSLPDPLRLTLGAGASPGVPELLSFEHRIVGGPGVGTAHEDLVARRLPDSLTPAAIAACVMGTNVPLTLVEHVDAAGVVTLSTELQTSVVTGVSWRTTKSGDVEETIAFDYDKVLWLFDDATYQVTADS